MGTTKNDTTMLWHMVQKFFYEKIKIKKKGTPFATVGNAWETPSNNKELVIFWGVRSLLRPEIATALPEYRCAFAFGKTSPKRQLYFLEKNIPSIVVLTSTNIILHPTIVDFLSQKHISIVKAIDIPHAIKTMKQLSLRDTPSSQIKEDTIDQFDKHDPIESEIQVIEKYTSIDKYHISNINVYINIHNSLIDIISESNNKYINIVINTPHKINFDIIAKKIDEYLNIDKVYILSSYPFRQKIEEYCNKRNITLTYISEEYLFNFLFIYALPISQEKNSHIDFALIWDLSETDSVRIAPCLSCYSVIRLNPSISYDTFISLFPLVAKKYSFSFFDYECAMPERIHRLAKETDTPIYYIYESLLGKLYYRKPYANPLFITISKEKQNALGLPDRATFTSWLDQKNEQQKTGKPSIRRLPLCGLLFKAGLSDLSLGSNNKQTTPDANELFIHMRSLHDLLLKGRKAPEQTLIDIQKKQFVLAVWHVEEAEKFSLDAFITEISKRVQQSYIVCLALDKGKISDQKVTLTGSLRFRTIFLPHAEDFDYLCPYAKEVHVVGSFYGFEALLSGCLVVTYGEPFYAGFGWTKDMASISGSQKCHFQEAAITALFGKDIYAPYTGEKITPDQALALHHLWIRSDFSYVFEQLANRLGKDERYPTLDLRRKYYHTIDKETTQYILKNLSGSNIGVLLNSLFNFKYTCTGLEKFLACWPTQLLFNLLIAITIYCRVNSLFDMLSNVIEKYTEWFSKNSFCDQEVYTFYTIYSFLQHSNRYREIPLPEFKVNVSSKNIDIHKIYARISIYSCHYQEFYTVFESLPTMPIAYYTSVLIFLMEYPYGSREKDFNMRLALRQKVFSVFLDTIIANEKVAISENSISLIRYSLAEDRPKIQQFATAVLSEQDQGIVVTPTIAAIFSNLLTAYIARCYYPEAELFLRIISNSEIKKEVYLNQWKRLRKIADGFIPIGMTSARRKQQIENTIQSTYQVCLKKTSLQDVYTQSWRAAIEEFNLKTSEIIARVPQPEHPLGYIFIPQFGLFQTAILPLLICALAKRGYASIILANNHLFIQQKNHSVLYKFAYSAIERPMQLSCPWEIDLERKKIIAFNMNFYDRFEEFLRVQLRIFTVDFSNPIQKSYLQQFIYQADAHLKICHELYQIHQKTGLKCGLLSSFLLLLPQVIWLDFIAAKKDKNFRTIFCRTALTQKMREGIDMEDVSICAMDMACHPEQRLPFLPTREKFQSWYQEFRKAPLADQILAEVCSSLMCPAPTDSPVYDRLLKEKASGKKIIFCYSRLLYDLSLRTADGGPGHKNMEDWLRHSIQIAAENKNIFLVIKPHPHEEEPEFAAMPVEKLQDILPELPDNVLLLHPKALKTPQLLGIVDMVALWLGTAIGELTALGIPVVVCSYAGISDTPFDVKTFKDRDEYGYMLKNASCPPPSQEEQNMAAGMIKFSREGRMVTPYPYSFFSASNDFRSIPYYNDAAIDRYFVEGDSDIEHVVDQILEGFNTTD